MTVTISKPAINIREKLAELDKPTGIAGEAMLRAETPQEQFHLIGAGRRNAIINGDFQISQRGDYSSATSVTADTYYVDRFYHGLSGVTANVQHVTDSFSSRVKRLKITATSSATGYMGISQRTTREENRHLFANEDAGYVVFSLWMKSNTSNAGIYIYNGTQLNRQGHSGNGQWEHLVCRAPLSKMTNTTADFHARMYDNGTVSINSGDYIEIAYVQVERNATGVATPFEHRPYGEELALCQRYFYRHTNGTVTGVIGPAAYYSSSDVRIPVSFPVTMRATPSLSVAGGTNCFVVFSNGTADYLSTATINAAQPNGMNLRNTTEASGTSGAAGWGETASGVNTRIDFDAEL
jgi:hypothetical protein